MKIVLLSDIHANYTYLSSLWKEVEIECADRIIHLGDLVGYYDEPGKVIEFCMEKEIECLRGNHEEFLLGMREYDRSKEKLYHIKEHRKSLKDEQLSFLQNLSNEIWIRENGVTVYCTHSVPRDTNSYIYSFGDIRNEWLEHCDYYCYGHTHIPIVAYRYGKCIVNPGSVGQPRDYTTRPSYAVIDTDLGVSIRKVIVDMDTYIQRLKESRMYDQSLMDILQRTKGIEL